jgi:hypothetical protein
LEIRLISSLTPEDEARYATTFIKVMAAMLENMPITYAIHVQLADGSVVDHSYGLRLLEPSPVSPGAPPVVSAGSKVILS